MFANSSGTFSIDGEEKFSLPKTKMPAGQELMHQVMQSQMETIRIGCRY